MADTHPPHPVLSIVAAFSRHEAALEWGRSKLMEARGPIALASPAFDFCDTDYYEPTMGAGIKKTFWAFERLADPGDLAALKLATNAWEQELAGAGRFPEPRPLNLDPGYITLSKLVLASTKDYAHRIYLGQGIYAEITLHWRLGAWVGHEWTFPDYRRADYHEFFTRCRRHLHTQLRRP